MVSEQRRGGPTISAKEKQTPAVTFAVTGVGNAAYVAQWQAGTIIYIKFIALK